MFTDRMETQGWKLHKVLREWQSPGPHIKDNGDVVREYNLECVMVRPPRDITMHVSDSAVPRLLDKYKGRIKVHNLDGD